MRGTFNAELRKDVMDAIREGYSVQQTADLLGLSGSYINNVLAEMIDAGSVVRTGRGKYEIPPQSNGAAHPDRVIAPKNGKVATESVKRTATIPEFIKGRQAVTLYVERSPEELESVMRLELCIGGAWFPVPLMSDLRLCVGDDVPRYSATQETYAGVKAFRVTFANGTQSEFNHNPDEPFTVDRKL